MYRLLLPIVLLAVWFIPTPTQPALALLSEYDPAQADRHMRALSQTIGVRSAGTEAEKQAADYIADQFRAYGLQPYTQTFPTYEQTSQNVIATLPGIDPGYGTLYIGAHYDSVTQGPGANDNASGVAVLLESARLLSTRELSATVTFIALGAEERGLVGSSYYAIRLSSADRGAALGMLNVDCAGVGDHQEISTTLDDSRFMVDRATQHAAMLGLPVEVETDDGRSDHAWFARVGIPSALVATADPDGGCGPFYHKAGDTLDTIDPAHMERVAQIVISTAYDVATTAPLRPVSRLYIPLLNLH